MNELNIRKQQRQQTLLRLAGEKKLATQQDVVRALRAAGIAATQATVSRDIVELGLVKVARDGAHVYAPPLTMPVSGGIERLRRFCEEYPVHGSVAGNLGSVKDLAGIQQKAIQSGAKKAIVHDARETFVKFFLWPALQAGALYEGRYPLATALGRPLLAKLLVDAARDEGARYVAHGSTGKGNDQVRFDLAVGPLAPGMTVVAPLRRGMNMTREDEIDYARALGIPVPGSEKSPYT